MQLFLEIAIKHLMARKRQSIVSLMGIVLGVAFFLSISALMQGSQKDFIRRLIDNLPHITIVDEFRNPSLQPVYQQYTEGAVELRNVKPQTEIRGIRGYKQIIEYLRTIPGISSSPVLVGPALISFSGKDYAVNLNGMIPEDIIRITTIENYMKHGSINELIYNPGGVIIGTELARKLALSYGNNVNIATTAGQIRTFKILGIFRTGRADYDERQVFTSLKRAQALLNRSNRINNIIIKLSDPYKAHDVARQIESNIGYKSISWQEASEDILSTLVIRNIIMYSVVSAVLVVAAFGIYNVISTVVMEKHRDIAILKSMGFHASDIQSVFIIQGVILGIAGSLFGLPLGGLMMKMLTQIQLRPPGSSEMVHMPVDWSWLQFVIASSFALVAAIAAAYLPARKAADLKPVDILRGGT